MDFVTTVPTVFAGQGAVEDLQAIGETVVDVGLGHQAVHEFAEASGNDPDLPSTAVGGVDHGKGAFGEVNLRVDLIQHARGHAFEQPDAFGQSGFEIQLTEHRTPCDLGYALA